MKTLDAFSQKKEKNACLGNSWGIILGGVGNLVVRSDIEEPMDVQAVLLRTSCLERVQVPQEMGAP